MAKSDLAKDGIALGMEQLQKAYQLEEGAIQKILGDSVFTAVQQNNYEFITLGDMQRLADALGLIFIMNFQSLDQYLGSDKDGHNGTKK